MPHSATTADEYLNALPDDRRAALGKVRQVILDHLPDGIQEGMQYGMIGYFVPHAIYPAGYHCDPKQPLPFAALASQKSHMAIYLMAIYQDPGAMEWMREQFVKHGKKPDIGKSCIRFKKPEDLPLEVIGEAVARCPAARYIAQYEANLPASARRGRK
jgi:hypothetical protein